MNRAVVFLFIGCASIAQAKTLHVSPQALSSVAADQQFRTIQAAADIVSAGDIVLIHSGVYRESVVVKKNGTRSQQIWFEAAPESNVVVTGLDPITEWRKEEGGANV